ncbi:MAG: DegV family protein [Gammaproteobacteria bacterium]|nr:DegV family protein [Gammaproteobacteria bacterium]
MRVGIAVDVSTDLSHEFVVRNRITVIPSTLHLGDTSLADTREPQSTLAFYAEHLADRGMDAETSAFSVEDIEKLFLDRLVLEYDYVFLITLTSKRSPTFQNAQRASFAVLRDYQKVRNGRNVPGPFALRVVDSQNVFTGPAVLAWEAVRLAGDGRTPSEIRKRLDELAFHTHAYLVPRDLYYIRERASKKGEKSVGLLSYLLGSALDIKPVLHCHRGETGPVAKVRHYENACERLFEHAAARIRKGLMVPVVCLSYGGDPAEIPRLAGYETLAQAARERGVELMHAMMSAVAAVNVGGEALTLAYCAEGAEFG